MTEQTSTNTYCDGPIANHSGPVDGYYPGPFMAAEKFEHWIERDGKHYCPECTKEMSGMTEQRMCNDCEGCGKVADTEDREPWTAWTSLPLSSAAAILVGLVKPIECPACHGTGKVP